MAMLVSGNAQENGKYAAWLLVLVLLTFGIHHAKEIIASILMKLYETIIQKNDLV